MKLAVIGMTKTGKSKFTTRLAQYGFERDSNDEYVHKKVRSRSDFVDLGDELLSLAGWVGRPGDSWYPERSGIYKKHDFEYIEMFADKVQKVKNKYKSMVLDMTGSSIYACDEILKELYSNTNIIQLRASPETKEKNLAKFLSSPCARPIIWEGMEDIDFNQLSLDEQGKKYTELGENREVLFSRWGRIAVNADSVRNREIEETIHFITKHPKYVAL